MRRLLLLSLVALCVLGLLPTNASAAKPGKVVVDDDRAQCANADFVSIGEAVRRALPGATVQVCPGRYAESVVVDKPLSIRGQLDAVDGVDCFDPAPAELGDADATKSAIIEPPDSSTGSLFTLAADGIELAGFVIQGLDRPTPTTAAGYPMYTPAVATSSGYSGFRIHHNVIRNNTFGIEFGSSGAVESRVHHNCLRENRWGLSNQRHALKAARVDHNHTFTTEFVAYEVGWGYAGTERVTLDHNVSRSDQYAYVVENSTATRIDKNTVGAGGRAIWVFGGNTELAVTKNVLSGGRMGGVVFVPPSTAVPEPTTAALIRGNTITGFVNSSGINLAAQARVTGSEITGNVTSGNALSGILLGPGNSRNIVRGNTADRNGQFGIRTLPNTRGNTIESNQMLANRQFDAREETLTAVGGVTQLGNDWIANRCVTDYPDGAICETA